MKQESLLERYRDAKEYGIDVGYGIGQDNAPEYSLEAKETYLEECLETEMCHFRQFSPFESHANEFNRPVQFFDRDGNMVKEEAQEWVNDKVWDKYNSGVYQGLQMAWREWKELVAV